MKDRLVTKLPLKDEQGRCIAYDVGMLLVIKSVNRTTGEIEIDTDYGTAELQSQIDHIARCNNEGI